MKGFIAAAMNTSKNSAATSVLPIRVCMECDELLSEASDAMRRHAGYMTVVMELIRRRDITEEVRQDFKSRLVASFKDAQSTWDGYREHLFHHGILPNVS